MQLSTAILAAGLLLVTGCKSAPTDPPVDNFNADAQASLRDAQPPLAGLRQDIDRLGYLIERDRR